IYNLYFSRTLSQAGVEDEELYLRAQEILLKLGKYFQAQDDFLDCFGDVGVTGKIGTDIADGKCSWLVVECILRASSEELQIIQKCYGRSDEASQSAVRTLYEKLRLPEAFRTYEARAQEEIIQTIETWDVPDTGDSWTPRHLFRLLTYMLFERSR
ncbi:farnesyl diphosphate synthase, partial [Paragonimus westermani]